MRRNVVAFFVDRAASTIIIMTSLLSISRKDNTNLYSFEAVLVFYVPHIPHGEVNSQSGTEGRSLIAIGAIVT